MTDADSDVIAQLRTDLARAKEQLRTFELALDSSRVIGAAVGIIMATQKMTYDSALQLLRDYSRVTSRKVRDLAERIVLTGSVKPPDGPGA